MEHTFDFLLAALVAFFGYIGATAIIDGGSLANSIAGVAGLVFSGVFAIALLSKTISKATAVNKNETNAK